MIVNLSTPQNNFFERTDTLRRYYDDIRKYTPFTLEEERKLILKYHKTTNQEEKRLIRDKIMCANQRFVLGVTRRWATNDNLLDLISEANMGMAEALDEYDINQKVRFITFAVFYIRRSINSYLLKHGNMVKKNNLPKTNHLISQIVNSFMQKEYRQPTLEEIVEILQNKHNVSIKDINDVLSLQVTSIDEHYGCEEDDANTNILTAFNKVSASVNNCEAVSNQEFAEKMVNSMLNKLTPIEQDVIKYVFGIGHSREYELGEIADKMNFTSERIRQIKIKALEKIRKAYAKVANTI
jgi:RNA polymerase primary sigma factor